MSDELERVSPFVNPSTRNLKRERDICPICGGFTGKSMFVRRLPAANSEGVPYPIAPVPPIKICSGHPEPAQKHDGRLNEDGSHNVYPNNFGGIAIHANDGITWMEAKEALSLLAWLRQEEAELQRLAKEQEE